MSEIASASADVGRPADIALRVDAAARAVAGVAELFYAAPLPARLWRATVAREGAFSVVAHGADGLRATVSIGVAGGRIADVAREVAERVRDALGDPDAHVTVRVSRITSTARA